MSNNKKHYSNWFLVKFKRGVDTYLFFNISLLGNSHMLTSQMIIEYGCNLCSIFRGIPKRMSALKRFGYTRVSKMKLYF